jgi:hypothetical protein
MVVVAQRSQLFVSTAGVSRELLASKPKIKCTVDRQVETGQPVVPDPLPPVGSSDQNDKNQELPQPCVTFVLQKPPFLKALLVRLDLTVGDVNPSSLSFHMVSPWNPGIRIFTSFVLLAASGYLTLALPSLSEDFENVSRLGLGGVTLAALFIPTLRGWIGELLHHNFWAIFLALLFALVTVGICCRTEVYVNRTAQTMVLVDGENKSAAKLEPGQWTTTFKWFGRDKQPEPGKGYCDLKKTATPSAHCKPMFDGTDLPFLLRLFRKHEYGCSMNQPGNPDLVAAWKSSKTCMPSLVEWTTKEIVNGLQDVQPKDICHSNTDARGDSKNAGAPDTPIRQGAASCVASVTVACEPTTQDGQTVCNLPAIAGDGLRRQFHSPDTTSPPPVDLRLNGSGMIREVFFQGLQDASSVILPFPNKAQWALADVELGGRKIGQSLLRPCDFSQPACDAHRQLDPGNCWLLPSGEYLAELVLRAKDNAVFARFTATDASAVATIPMCWSGVVDAIEVRLDKDWSPRDGWRVTIPPAMEPRDVRIYWAPIGYWGTATWLSRPGESPPESCTGQPTNDDAHSGSSQPQPAAGKSLVIEINRVQNVEGKPTTSFDRLLRAGDARRESWSGRVTDPEWLWTVHRVKQSEGYISKSHPSVYVDCCAVQEGRLCTARDRPMPCYFQLDGLPITSAQCPPRIRQPPVENRALRRQYKLQGSRRNCSEVILCDTKEDS